MTLEEAGKIYVEQLDKLKAVKSNLSRLRRALYDQLNLCEEQIPMNREFLEEIADQLQDHKKHLEHVLQKEV